MAERVHGHAPRVRRAKNEKRGVPQPKYEISINGEELINTAVDASISAGVAYIISKTA